MYELDVWMTQAINGLSGQNGLADQVMVLVSSVGVRPYDGGITHLLVERSADPSFPSDHATAAFAIAAAFLFHGMERRGLAFLSAAILVAFSRIYIGTHYVSDVLGGVLIGILAAGTIFVLYKPGTRVDRMVTGIL
jgi:undecaprenyl-diphosphatase